VATTIRDLLVKLGVDGGDADKQVAKLDSALSDLKDVMLGVVAVGAAVTGAIAGLAISAANAGDEVAKGAARTGIAVESYQELAHAFEQSGLEATQLEQALVKQTEALSQVEADSGAAAAAYDELGLSQADLAGLGTDQALYATAEALAGVSDEQERLQLATDIYGAELASKLMPALAGGADGLGELADQAHALGIVMSTEQVEAATLFGDTLAQVWDIVEGIKNTIGLALLPTLTDWLAKLRDWYVANQDVINTRLEQWIGVVVAGLQSLERAAVVVNDLVVSVFGGWGPILAAVAAAVAAVGAVVAGLAALKAWAAIQSILAVIGTVGGVVFAKIVVGILAVAAAIVGLYLVIDDLIVYFNGGDSALGRFLDRFRDSEGVLGAAARTVESLIGMLGSLWAVVQELGAIWWAVFSRTTLPALQLLGAGLLWLAEVGLGALGWYWDNVVGPMFSAFGAALDWVLGKLQALQPALQVLLGGLDSVLGAVSDITGVDVTVGGGVTGGDEGGVAALGDTLGTSAALADSAAASAAFAPSTAEAAGAAAFAAPTTTTQTTEVAVEGNTYTISGVGWTEDDLLALIARAEDERARATSAALEGAEV
jgi:hypothetical protein